jgi:hypothetical protein
LDVARGVWRSKNEKPMIGLGQCLVATLIGVFATLFRKSVADQQAEHGYPFYIAL